MNPLVQAHIDDAGEVMHLVGACRCVITDEELEIGEKFQRFLEAGCILFASKEPQLTVACTLRVLYVLYTQLLAKMPEGEHALRPMQPKSETNVN